MYRFFPNHRLTSAERALIPEVFFQLFAARLRVTFLPSEKYLPAQTGEALSSIIPTSANKKSNLIANVINGVAVRTPWRSTCLVRVLATHHLLRKEKIPHTVFLGIKKHSEQRMAAHAWLSVADKIIIGGDSASAFTVISAINC